MTFDLERMAILLHGQSYLLSVGVVFLFVNYRAGQSLCKPKEADHWCWLED